MILTGGGKNRSIRAAIFAIVCTLAFAACEIPSLEAPECTESRNIVREFYSFHLGNDMNFNAENLKLREKFLTKEFAASLAGRTSTDDVFTTNSADLPKAFRVGSCRVVSPGRTLFSVLLFWRDDTRSEQREIKVEAVRQNDEWLIDKVSY